jgi:hypothetical protein
MVTGTLQALAETGRRVPHDVAVSAPGAGKLRHPEPRVGRS